MRFFVTGALGTLGRPLVKELRERGHEVTGCDLRHSSDVSIVRADVSDMWQLHAAASGLMTAIGECAIVHLAAEFGRLNGRDYPRECWLHNCVGTRNVLRIASEFDARVVFASSSEIYGEPPADGEPWSEGITEQFPVWPANDYAISKWANEMQCRNAIRGGIPVTILRFFNAYGPGEEYHPYRSVVALFCYRLLRGLPIRVYRDYHRVFQYIDDFIPTLATACELDAQPHPINIGGEEYRSVEELAEIVLAETGADRSLVMYEDKDVTNTVNKRPDITRARTLLGHDPKVTLEDGVRRTVEWMRSFYGIQEKTHA